MLHRKFDAFSIISTTVLYPTKEYILENVPETRSYKMCAQYWKRQSYGGDTCENTACELKTTEKLRESEEQQNFNI